MSGFPHPFEDWDSPEDSAYDDLRGLHAIEVHERVRHRERIIRRYTEYSEDHPIDFDRWFSKLPAAQQAVGREWSAQFSQRDWDQFAAEQEERDGTS